MEPWLGVILEAVPRAIEDLAGQNRKPPVVDILSSFRMDKVPSIPLVEYFARFHEFGDCSATCYLFCLIYIDRLLKRPMQVTALHMHRLALTSWVVASKFLEDEIYTNTVYSRIGGLKEEDSLSQLELEFLCMIGFDLYVTEAECMNYFERVLDTEGAAREMVEGANLSKQSFEKKQKACLPFSCEASIAGDIMSRFAAPLVEKCLPLSPTQTIYRYAEPIFSSHSDFESLSVSLDCTDIFQFSPPSY